MTNEQIVDLSREILDSFVENDIIPKDYEFGIIEARDIIFHKIHQFLDKKEEKINDE